MTSIYEMTINAGLAAMEQGDSSKARSAFAEAISIDPSQPVPFFLLASEHAAAGENDQAEAAYISALERAPDFNIARFQLGLLQLTNQRPSVAFATWERLFSLNPDQHLHCFSMGLRALHFNDALAAQGMIEKGLALNLGNEALNTDMKGVLARLDDIKRSSLNEQIVPESNEVDDHVLLSGYRNKADFKP
jgi:tetratricopeptide (TPR) repeat protein